MLLANPAEALPEVKEHLQDAIKEVAEFVVPMRSQRFRKRDRMYFIGRRFMRKVSENVGGLAKVSRDPSTRRKAISRLTKNFLRYG